MPAPDPEPSEMPCPLEKDLVELAAGAAEVLRADALLSHCANCSVCAARLKEALSLFEDAGGTQGSSTPAEFLAGLAVSTREGRRALAGRLAGDYPLKARGAVSRLRIPWRSAAAVAAVAAVLVIAVVVTRRPSSGVPLKLLAQSYGELRTLELRIDGAAFTPLRVERGEVREETPEMLDALASIRKNLDARSNDAGYLHAQGRAELMKWRFDDAIQSLQQAAKMGLDNAPFWVDLASAFVERGDANQTPSDYRRSLQLLDDVLLKRPGYSVALFNRAVVRARLKDFDGAAQDFEAVLRNEKDTSWLAETQERLKALKSAASAPSHL